jgi:hypothetical protein
LVEAAAPLYMGVALLLEQYLFMVVMELLTLLLHKYLEVGVGGSIMVLLQQVRLAA